uniref:Uncharacterized protein n=1 Tax=Triticum urartu TaxID=4572 RepID=A0A8R7PWT3_TRIUA
MLQFVGRSILSFCKKTENFTTCFLRDKSISPDAAHSSETEGNSHTAQPSLLSPHSPHRLHSRPPPHLAAAHTQTKPSLAGADALAAPCFAVGAPTPHIW